MSRFPLLMILFSVLVLIGCSKQSGTSSGGGTSTSSSGGTTTTSSSGGTTTSSSGGTTTSSGGPDPDPTDDFPSSGVPDQNSSTLVAESYNVRGRNFAGTQINITAFLADQLNNSSTIADGTQVLFATEAGAIQSSCTTANGTCSVTWRSQQPIPSSGPPVVDPLGSGEMVTSFASGRAAILMWTVGSESFIDNNSNGLFDDGDVRDPDDPDRGEAFLDKNENATRDSGEEFVDFELQGFNVPGASYDPADGLYSGPNCARTTPADCSINQSTFIFKNIQLTMSSDFVCLVPVGPFVIPGGGMPNYYPSLAAGHPATSLTTGSQFTFRYLVHDCFGNPPISGTKIEFGDGPGDIIGPTSFTVGNTTVDMGTTSAGDVRQRYPSGSIVYSVTVRGSPENDTEVETGVLTVTATTPAPANQSVFDAIDLTDPLN